MDEDNKGEYRTMKQVVALKMTNKDKCLLVAVSIAGLATLYNNIVTGLLLVGLASLLYMEIKDRVKAHRAMYSLALELQGYSRQVGAFLAVFKRIQKDEYQISDDGRPDFDTCIKKLEAEVSAAKIIVRELKD